MSQFPETYIIILEIIMKTVIIVILLLLLYIYLTADNNIKFVRYRGDDTGYKLLDVFSESEVNYILGLVNSKKYLDAQRFIHNHSGFLTKMKQLLGEDYVFANYIYTIEKSSVSTCHRDESGKVFNPTLKHPSYTILFYLEPMEACLDIIPGTHKEKNIVYISKSLESIPCKPGQAIIFNADLIHSGSINKQNDNKRIQMKIVHKEDMKTLDFLNNYHKIGDASKSSSMKSIYFYRKLSCIFPGISDITRNGNALPPMLNSLYKKLVYGDEDNYKLKNVEQ
jgi:hypothetical protein